MKRQALSIQSRTVSGKNASRQLRAEGFVPAVLYARGKEAIMVQAKPKSVVAILNGAYGKNSVLDITVGDETESRLSVIRDYSVHPFKRTLEHVDFWQIEEDTILTVKIPFSKQGRSASERQGGSAKIKVDQIFVKCKAADIPERIVFDMTALPIGEHNIFASQIPVPEGVEVYFKQDYPVIQVTMPKVVAEVAVDPKAKKGQGKK